MSRRIVHRSPVPPEGVSRRRPPRSTCGLRWRLFLWRVRFPVAAALLGIATAQIVAELRPTPPPTVPVVVAALDLPPGAVIAAADVRVAAMPTTLVPGGSHVRADEVVGRALVVGAPVGLPIVGELLAGERFTAAGPPGTVVAPVRLADPAVAALLRPGDRIDLLATAGTASGEPTARHLADRALVLPDPRPVTEQDAGAVGGLLGGGTEVTVGALTLVAVTPVEAAALAGSLGWASLSAVIVK